eukprot:10066115-Alexandrium_andersonii.AAC.1
MVSAATACATAPVSDRGGGLEGRAWPRVGWAKWEGKGVRGLGGAGSPKLQVLSLGSSSPNLRATAASRSQS